MTFPHVSTFSSKVISQATNELMPIKAVYVKQLSMNELIFINRISHEVDWM